MDIKGRKGKFFVSVAETGTMFNAPKQMYCQLTTFVIDVNDCYYLDKHYKFRFIIKKTRKKFFICFIYLMISIT